MTAYKDLSKDELKALKKELTRKFEEVKAKGLKLDMSRGKPSTEQLNLSMGMMDVLTSSSDLVVRRCRLQELRSTRWNPGSKAASGGYDGSTKGQYRNFRKFQSECHV